MKRNIIISFIVHIIAIGLLCLLFTPFIDLFYGSKRIIVYLTLLGIVLMFIIYFVAGWRFLKPTDSKRNDFKSIFFLVPSLLIYYILIYAFALTSGTDSMMFLFYGTNPFYMILTALEPVIGNKMSDIEGLILSIIFLCFSIIAPSLGLFAGYKLQRRGKDRTD